MKRIFTSLSVFAIMIAMAVGAQAQLTSKGSDWFYETDKAGTLTVKDNKKDFVYELKAGKTLIGKQSGYTGQLKFVSFVETKCCQYCDGVAVYGGYVAGDCYSNGYTWFSCSKCNAWFYGEIFETMGHNLETTECGQYLVCTKPGCNHWEYAPVVELSLTTDGFYEVLDAYETFIAVCNGEGDWTYDDVFTAKSIAEAKYYPEGKYGELLYMAYCINAGFLTQDEINLWTYYYAGVLEYAKGLLVAIEYKTIEIVQTKVGGSFSFVAVKLLGAGYTYEVFGEGLAIVAAPNAWANANMFVFNNAAGTDQSRAGVYRVEARDADNDLVAVFTITVT